MGLFSTKKKHFVDSSVVRVVEDEYLPNTLRLSVLEAVFRNQPMGETIIGNVLTANFRNFERAYRYARDGEYAFGLPDQRILSSSQANGSVLEAIYAEDPEAAANNAQLEYVFFKPVNNFFLAWKALYETYGYNRETNTLTASWLNDREVYLERIVAQHTSEEGLEVEVNALGSMEQNLSQQGAVPEALALERADQVLTWDAREEARIGQSLEEGYFLEVVWVDDDDALQRDSLFVSMAGVYDEDREYYHAKYFWGQGTGKVTRFWIYDTADGLHETLDTSFRTPEDVANGTFFPFVVFRQEGEDRTAPKFRETPQYLTTVELCDKFGLDYQELADEINANPDIEDVRQAVMTMAVPLTTDDEAQVEYLFLYFKQLQEQMGYVPPTSINDYSNNLVGPSESYAVEFTDADFSLRLSFDRIQTRFVLGSIGEIGTITNEEETLNVGSDINNTGVFINVVDSTQLAGNKTRVIRRQVYDNIYEELKIQNPQFRYEVFNTKGVEGGIDDERLLIPVDMELAQEISLTNREDLYHRSLQLVFNSHIIQKVKWYERGAFKALLIIVAVVIALFDKGLTLKTVLTFLAAGGTAAYAVTLLIVTTIIEVLVISKLISLGLEKLSKVLGAELTALIAVAAVLYGVAGQFDVVDLLFKLTPMDLINIASNLIENVIELEFADLVQAYGDFEEYKEGQLDLLADAQDLLGDPLNINPLLFVYRQPMTVLGEGASAFYQRTIGNTNPGVQSLDFIQNFYDTSLTLPESTRA